MYPIRAALLQTSVYDSKEKSLESVETAVREAARKAPDFICLPEMFCCPYRTEVFPAYAEEAGGHVWEFCSHLAKEYGVWLIAGSMPEKDRVGNIYNTSFVFDRQGNQAARCRKAHLFNVSIEGGQRFRESDALSPGKEITVFDTEFGKMGLCICYDLRFPELIRLMALKGALAVFVPAAFNPTTGPAHWELLFRSRAVDNQIFMAGIAPARNPQGPYLSWGHTLAADPWGNIIGELGTDPGTLQVTFDLDMLQRVRRELPLLTQRRQDLYSLLPASPKPE